LFLVYGNRVTDNARYTYNVHTIFMYTHK